ncbi:hypothetical protein L1987_54861 [Smallanthus sonchifolius]|uniref:Uncharacterized protein n=1 Tax=Smallanthus sonchifolius TaxID=185202 RepID=A0ACB9E8Z2_9ASTR|nr:hypothetical protein L1987_54861 [Smallanthus sonchifolius]
MFQTTTYPVLSLWTLCEGRLDSTTVPPIQIQNSNQNQIANSPNNGIGKTIPSRKSYSECQEHMSNGYLSAFPCGFLWFRSCSTGLACVLHNSQDLICFVHKRASSENGD